MIQVPLVFLSHAGEDEREAIALGKNIKQTLASHGFQAEVFNTSESEYRFKEFTFKDGVDLQLRLNSYEKELADYLRSRLRSSTAYILLITEESLMKAQAQASGWRRTNWIAFEMEIADQEATTNTHREKFFFPCVSGKIKLNDLPKPAMMYQGISLSESRGFDKLIQAVEEVAALVGQALPDKKLVTRALTQECCN